MKLKLNLNTLGKKDLKGMKGGAFASCPCPCKTFPSGITDVANNQFVVQFS